MWWTDSRAPEASPVGEKSGARTSVLLRWCSARSVAGRGHSSMYAPSKSMTEDSVGTMPLTDSSTITYCSALAMTANGWTRL